MTSKHTGEVDITIGKKECIIVFDLRAVSVFQTKFGVHANINDFDIDKTIATLLIGLKKHNEEVTKANILDASPAMVYLSDKIVEAFIYANHGPEKGREMVEKAKKAVEEIEKKTLPMTET